MKNYLASLILGTSQSDTIAKQIMVEFNAVAILLLLLMKPEAMVEGAVPGKLSLEPFEKCLMHGYRVLH